MDIKSIHDLVNVIKLDSVPRSTSNVDLGSLKMREDSSYKLKEESTVAPTQAKYEPVCTMRSWSSEDSEEPYDQDYSDDGINRVPDWIMAGCGLPEQGTGQSRNYQTWGDPTDDSAEEYTPRDPVLQILDAAYDVASRKVATKKGFYWASKRKGWKRVDYQKFSKIEKTLLSPSKEGITRKLKRVLSEQGRMYQPPVEWAVKNDLPPHMFRLPLEDLRRKHGARTANLAVSLRLAYNLELRNIKVPKVPKNFLLGLSTTMRFERTILEIMTPPDGPRPTLSRTSTRRRVTPTGPRR